MIAATLAVRHPGWRGVSFDRNPDAIRLARENLDALGAAGRVGLIAADGFDVLDGAARFDLLVSNPPYVPTGEIDGLEAEVSRYESRIALDGGEEGLDFHRVIAEAGGALLRPGGAIALEIGAGQ